MKPVRIHRAALRQWHNCAHRYDEEERGLGDDFTDEVDTALRAIEENPSVGVRIEAIYQAKTLKRFPHYVVFVERRKASYVIAIHHPGQDSFYWNHRLAEVEDD